MDEQSNAEVKETAAVAAEATEATDRATER